MKRAAVALLVVLILALAGWGILGGGVDGGLLDGGLLDGSGGADRSVELVNAADLKTGVSPGDRPTVKADVTGDDLHRVAISYSVSDRANEVVAAATEPMARSGEHHVYQLPGYPAGYDVEYEVRATYDDGETRASSSIFSYASRSNDSDGSNASTSYVERVVGPKDGETVSERRSEITVELATSEAVQYVEVQYTRDLPETGESVTNTTVVHSVDSTTVTLPIYNEESGEAITQTDVSYAVTVAAGTGDQDTWQTTATKSFQYQYRSEREDVLVVPVTYESQTTRVEDITNSAVDANFTHAMAYYENESGGAFSPTYEWIANGSPSGYFVLDGDPQQYVGERISTQQIRDTGSVEEYKIGYKHDREKIRCAAAGEIKEQYPGFEFDRYEAVVFVQTDVAGTIEFVRTGRDGENETYRREAKPMRAYNLGEWSATKCGNVETTGSHVVLSAEDNYATIDHELGHAVFGWGDYYGTTGGKRGVVGFWGLMGSGNNRDEYPSSIMAYHKFREGWIEGETVGSLDRGESETVFLPYLNAKETTRPYHRTLVYSTYRSPSIFTTYVFEARNPPNRNHERQNGWGAKTSGPGLVAYGAKTGHSVNVVWNDEPNNNWERTHPNEPTIYARNYGKTVNDPDAGLQFSLTENSNRSDDGLRVTLSNPGYRNLQGVNVRYRVDCENIAYDCGMHQTATNDTEPIVGLLAYTHEGRVGVTANGTVVDEVPGAYVFPAGNTYKVFVPNDLAVQYEVDASQIHENATVDLRTQTVSRDSNGRRTASEIENQTVEGGETARPDLARLNLSKQSWDAGQVRTRDGNRTTLVVRNRGIASLEDVTVRTDSPWVSTDWVERERLDDAESVTLAEGEFVGLGVEFEVPGGTPVGTYTFNVTVSASGAETTQTETSRSGATQTETMEVTVDVLPTAYWNATPANATRIVEGEGDSTKVEVVVHNSPHSNVPLYDVESRVAGSVTALTVDEPRTVESVEPGESANLTTTLTVPEGDVEEGPYPGVIAVEPTVRYQQSETYPVAVPQNYAVVEPRRHATNVTVEVY